MTTDESYITFNLAEAAYGLTPADTAVYHSREYTSLPWRRAAHLDLINEALVMVANGEILRLGIFVPPRYGKSKLVSIYFPAWYLGNNPDKKIILAANEANLASTWGAAVRDILTEMGPSTFGISVDQKSSDKSNWTIEGRQGGMRSAGVGGSIVGRGADILVLDDVVKGHEQAFSKTIQDRNINWWQADALSRLEPGGGVVYIQTRWHEEDLAGKVLRGAEDNEGQDAWVVIQFSEISDEDNEPPISIKGDASSLPPSVIRWMRSRNKKPKYLRKKGEALWPWRWSLERSYKRKAEASEYIWNAIHQQRPMAAGGLIFSRDHFTIVPITPTDAIRVRFWDVAGSKNSGDFTVGALVSYEPSADILYIEDIKRGQWSPAEVKYNIKLVAEQDGMNVRVRCEQEPGSSGLMFTDELQTILSDFNFAGVRATGAKELRWDAMTAAIQHQRLVLVEGRWNKKFIQELELLPAGKHDDQADAAAGAYNELLKQDRGRAARITLL